MPSILLLLEIANLPENVLTNFALVENCKMQDNRNCTELKLISINYKHDNIYRLLAKNFPRAIRCNLWLIYY